MNESLEDIPDRILHVAEGALTQANTHAVFCDPGNEHWDHMSVLNAALAGELFLKAIIAKVHPLLIFNDLFRLDQPDSQDMDVGRVIAGGRTYSFEHLPKLLWVVTGERIPDFESFETIRRVRNSIQHFCAPDGVSFRKLSLEFIYKNIDPLMHEHFGLCAINYHEDHSIGYDYVVDCIVRHELFFSVPAEFDLSEVDLRKTLSTVSVSYRDQLMKRLLEAGFNLYS